MSGPDMESRLRAAYDARTRLANVDTSQRVPDFAQLADVDGAAGRPAQPGTPWRTALLVAATVVAVAGASAAIAAVTNRHSAQPGTSPTGVPTNPPSTLENTPAKVAMLGLGEVGSRAQVPWSLVGQGWTVVTWSAPGASANAAWTAFLVDPVGGRYSIASVPRDSFVADVAGDHSRALLYEAQTRIVQLDLRSGSQSHITDVDGALAEYTKPTGAAIIVTHPGAAGSQTQIARYGLDGSLQHTYAPVNVGIATYGLPLYTPDGASLVMAGAPAMTVMADDGSHARSLGAPSGARACSPARWWQPSVILSSCDTAQGRQLWLIPLTGDSLHPLTALNSGSDALANPYTAWSFGAVVIGLDAPPCGSASQFITIAANGLFDYTRVSAPPGLSASIIPSGATSDAVFGRAVNGCSEARAEALVRFSPATNGLTVLFGANVGGGSVQSARTIGVDS